MDSQIIEKALTLHVAANWPVAEFGPLGAAWAGDQHDHADRLAALVELIDGGLARLDPAATADLLGADDAPDALAISDDENLAVLDIELTRRRLTIGGRAVALRDADAGAQVVSLIVGLVAQTLGRPPRRMRRTRRMREARMKPRSCERGQRIPGPRRWEPGYPGPVRTPTPAPVVVVEPTGRPTPVRLIETFECDLADAFQMARLWA